MPRKLTYQEVKDYIEDDGYVLISKEYKNTTTHLELLCPEGHDWLTSFASFKSGARCKKCAIKLRSKAKCLTYEDVKNHIEENGYVLISNEYKKAKEKLIIKCPKNHEFSMRFDNFKQGQRCPECKVDRMSKNSRKETVEEIREFVELHGYKLINGERQNCKEKINLMCPNNHEWKTLLSSFKLGYRCMQCAIEYRAKIKTKTQEEFEKEVYLLTNGEYEVVGKYKKANTKIEIKHMECESTYLVKPNNFISNIRRCPICNESKGEQEIRHWLKSNEVKFEAQKEFDGLIGTGGGNLSYDFYLPNQNMLIEYQGEFHDGSGGEYTKLNLDIQQNHDNKKRKYAQDNNMKLLEIWHYDFKRIHDILQRELRLKGATIK